MKKLYTLLILAGCCLHAYSQHQAVSHTLSQPISGPGHHYQALEFIDMLPGFEYEAQNPGVEFVAEIVTELIPDIQYLEQPISSDRPLDYSLEVGTIEGRFHVDLKGRATYTIPVEVPPGTKGLKPNLEIQYKSTINNGYLGKGWNVKGLSAITRTGSTIFHDGFVTGVTMTDDDRFSFDGERLIIVNGLYGEPNSEYRTANESFSRITLFGNQNDGTEWFLVESKEGIKRYYGNSSNSRQWLPNSNAVLKWHLSRIEDNQGNYIDYFYRHDHNDTYIERIEYTGNSTANLLPPNTIHFIYGRRPHYYFSYYLLNDEIRSELLLTEIIIKAGNDNFVKYQFDYYCADDALINPLLNQIILVNSMGKYLNSTVFIYDNVETNYSGQPLLKPEGSYSMLERATPWVNQEINQIGGGTRMITHDFNNNGRDDFITFNDNHPPNQYKDKNKFVLGYDMNTMDGPRRNFTFEYSNPYVSGTLLKKHTIGDFNGDGYSDIALALVNEDSERDILILIYNPNTNKFVEHHLDNLLYSSVNDDHFLLAGNFRGNGKDMLLHVRYIGVGEIEFNFIDFPSSNYATSIFSPGYLFEIELADFSGNGIDEILVRDDDGYRMFSVSFDEHNNPEFVLLSSDSFPNSWNFVYTGNFNSDRRTDLLVWDNQNQNWRIMISTSNGFLSSPLGIPLSGPKIFWYGKTPPFIADLNGNGLTDLIDFGGDLNAKVKEKIDIYYNVGFNLFDHKEVTMPENIVDSLLNYFHLGDFNGDGAMELLYNQFNFIIDPESWLPWWAPWRPLIEVIVNNELITTEVNHKKQLLTTVLNGLNYKINVFYNYMAYGELFGYYEDWYWVDRCISILPAPYYTAKKQSYLVDSVLFYGGNGVPRQRYSYKCPIFNNQTSQFMGFKEIVKEINKGEKIKYFNHLFPTLDMMLTRETNNLAFTGEILESIDFEFSIFNTYPGVYFTYVYEVDKIDHLRNIRIRTQNIYSGPDINYGNLSQKTVKYFNNTNLHRTESALFNYTTAGSWCPSKVEEINNIHSAPGSPDILRRRNFEYFTTGENKGLLSRTVFNSNLQNPVTYTRDSYDQFGNLTKLTISGNDFDSRITELEYDEYGRHPIRTVNALGHESLFEYEPLFGNLTNHTDSRGLVTTFQYDGFGRINNVDWPDGTNIVYSYQWDDNFDYYPTYSVTEMASNGSLKHNYYNRTGGLHGKRYKDFNGNDVSTVFLYNEYNLLIIAIEPYWSASNLKNEQWTQYSYDAYNRLNNITSPIADISYSYSGNSVAVTDNNIDKETVYYYDAAGNLSAIFEIPDNQISYSYDAEGKLISTQVNQASYLNTYDDYGFPGSYWDMSVGLIEYEFNSLGSLMRKTDPKGFTFEYTYDKINRFQSESIVNGRSVQYFYDQTPESIGKLNEIQSSDGFTFTYTYDEYGRLESESELVNGETLSFNYLYNQNGQLSKIVYPNNFSIRQKYNDYGYLNKIIHDSSNEAIYEIFQSDLYGRPTEYHYGNDVNTYRDFNPVNKIISNMHVSSQYYGNTDIFSFTYSTCPIMYIIDGRKDNIRNLEESFSYDNYKRLTGVIGVGQVPSASFDYSSDGNILETHEAVYSYGNNASNHAVTALQLKSGASMPTIPQTIEYTPFNKVSKIFEGDFEYRLKYGPDNAIKESKLFENGILTKTKRYMKSFEKLTDDAGIKENSYIFGPSGLIAIHQRMNNVDEHLYYVHTDHLGSIIGLTDEIGAIVPGSINSFDAWGNRRNPETWQPFESPTPPLLFDRGYTGHEHIEKFALINMNGRVYDPKVARFLSPDPLIQAPGFSQSFNRYSYSLNNPINLVDRSGYYWDDYDDDYWEDDPPLWILADWRSRDAGRYYKASAVDNENSYYDHEWELFEHDHDNHEHYFFDHPFEFFDDYERDDGYVANIGDPNDVAQFFGKYNAGYIADANIRRLFPNQTYNKDNDVIRYMVEGVGVWVLGMINAGAGAVSGGLVVTIQGQEHILRMSAENYLQNGQGMGIYAINVTAPGAFPRAMLFNAADGSSIGWHHTIVKGAPTMQYHIYLKFLQELKTVR